MADEGDAAGAAGLQVFDGNESANSIYVLLNIRGDEIAAVMGMLAGISWDTITGKPAVFAPAAHSHSWGAITGKPVLVGLPYFDDRLAVGGSAPIYSTHGRNNPVVTSWVAAALDSQGRIAIQPSARRFKDIVGDYDGASALGFVPTVFTLKGDDELVEHIGFLADDVAELEPRAVVFDDAGAPLALDHNAILAMLVRDVQRLAARVTELEAAA